ncbi:MAG: sigma-54-dependent Fis family transcriptional regulator, partial [Alphaproteobacteria bacterium]|nr:sigma-54-dependent Fis family transcriptional regulator [Alphaproteobacteria bacterium]
MAVGLQRPAVLHYQACRRCAAPPSWAWLVDSGYRLITCTTRSEVKSAMASQHPAVALIHYGEEVDRIDAVELESFLETRPDLRWIAIVEKAVLGAEPFKDLIRRRFLYDFSTLPANEHGMLFQIRHICGLSAIERETAPVKGLPAVERNSSDASIGADPRFLKALDELRKAAKTNAPVLITGESGTGKELAAQIVHAHSTFRAGPLLAVNCAGMAPTLIASELFGHEKGAFTDAKEQKIGKIEAADGGSLLLDEIGDLPLELQGYLLRFLENKTIERVGGNRRLTINTRVIAATNVDLPKRIAEGRFRQDLYYRLNILSVGLPPLRKRGGDASLLARHYFEKFKAEFGRPHLRLREDALAAIARHSWPGNVRELIAVLRRAVVMADSNAIDAAALQLPLPVEHNTPATLQESVAKAERAAIEIALRLHNENVNRASQELGVSRVTLYRL